MPSRDQLAGFTAWCGKHITGDEKGEAQIFLDHLFQAFGFPGGLKEAGATLEMRIPKTDRGGTVTTPGVPPNYPNPQSLVTEDCIKPAT